MASNNKYIPQYSVCNKTTIGFFISFLLILKNQKYVAWYCVAILICQLANDACEIQISFFKTAVNLLVPAFIYTKLHNKTLPLAVYLLKKNEFLSHRSF